jgi:hypothetical protein
MYNRPLQAEMWERQGRAVKQSELCNPAKEVKKRGTKDELADKAAEEAAEVCSGMSTEMMQSG